jgi:four helix bundle protein
MAAINSFRDLIVYQKAFTLAMEIFDCSKSFPKEETYALTDQVRRSSRGVTSNLAESWAKKIYIKSFVNKISDALAEEYETEVWLDYALHCEYISESQHKDFLERYGEVRKILISMMNHPQKFCNKP